MEPTRPVASPFSITPEEVNALPVRRYEGEIVLVRDAQALQRALDDALACECAGFDTETRPAFRPGESYLPSVFQLATARAVYVFQLAQQDCSRALTEVLAQASLVKAGVSVADDLKNLKKLFPFEEAAVLDLGVVAKRNGYRQTGVRNLAALVLGFRVPKGAKTTNWAAPRLTEQQLVYAATDAWVCRELYLQFSARGLIAP
jgi:ribonuclease D